MGERMLEAGSGYWQVQETMRHFGRRLRRLLLIAFGLLAFAQAALAQLPGSPITFQGTPTAVGSSSSVKTVMLFAQAAGQITAFSTITGGVSDPNLQEFTFVQANTCSVGSQMTAGESCEVSVSFNPRFPGVRQGAVLIQSGSQVLASAPLSGIGQGGLPVLVPAEINTVAGNGQGVPQGNDGLKAINTSIILPIGLTVDAAGNLYLCESNSNRVRRVDASTGNISTVAGNGNAGSAGDGGQAVAAELNNPAGIAIDGAGNLYIADTGNNAVRRVDVSGTITTVVGTLGNSGYAGDGGPATSALLSSPRGLALTPGGDLILADTGNNRVRQFSVGSQSIQTIAGNGSAGYNKTDQMLATQAQLNNPYGVAVRSDGAVAIADTLNNRIRLIDTSGMISTIAGNGSGGFNGDSLSAIDPNTQLFNPESVAFDPQGDFVIADTGNNRVRGVIGGIIVTLAGNGDPAFENTNNPPAGGGDRGPDDHANLNGPSALFFDYTGNIWVSDYYNNRVREISGSLLGLTYPPMKVGKLSAPLVGTLYNLGNTTLTLQLPTAQANTLVQAALDSATTCGQSALAPMAFCIMSIEFAPTQVNANDTGSVTWKSDAPNVTPVDALNGEVLSVEPTTVAINSDAEPGLLGQPVTFTATVTSADTGRTGTITFTEGNNPPLCSAVPLASNGTATCKETFSLGSHTITASYSGDNNNAASTVDFTEIIKQAPTLVLGFSTATDPAIVGGNVSLTLSVGDQTGTPTETVTFFDGATALSPAVPLTSSTSPGVATATWNTQALAAGSHWLSAQYAGDGANAPGTSNSVNVQIAQPSTTVLVSSAPTTLVGKPAIFTASVTSAHGVPAGTVTFSDGAKILGTGSLNPNGVASFSTSSLTLGTHSVTAAYGGDSSDLPSSASLQQNVELAQPTLTLSGPTGAVDVATNASIVAGLNTPGVPPTGTLTLTDGANAYSAVAVTGNGAFTFSTSKLSIGTHVVTAKYSGDASNNAAVSTPITVVVRQADSLTLLSANPDPLTQGGALTLTATVSSDSPNVSGQVNFLDGTKLLGTATVDVNGIASVSPTGLALGTHVLTATYAGDANHGSSTSAPLQEVVVQSSSAVLTSDNNPAASGQNVTLTVQIHGSGSISATGSATLRDNGALLATVPLNSSGVGSFTTNTLAVGAHAITVSYGGDQNYAAAGAQLTEIVIGATTTVELGASGTPAVFGQPLNLTATVSSNGGVATGVVSFTDGGVTIGTAPLNANGIAVLTTATLAPGSRTIVASYAGDGKASPSASTPLLLTVKQTTAVAVASSSNPALTLSPLTFTVSVVNAGAAPATGMVSFADGATVLGAAQLDGSGHATLTIPQLSAGMHNVVASYAGDGANFASASGVYAENVQLRPTETTLTGSSTDPTNPQQMTLIAVVKSLGSTAPSGSVTFTSGSVTMGVATVDDTGVATITVIFEQTSQPIVASYAGDASYSASKSSSTTITAGQAAQFTLAVNAPSITLVTHQHTTVNVSIGSVKGFTDTIALGCLGLPFAGTCTFTPSLVKLSPDGTATAALIIDTGDPLGAGTGTTAALQMDHKGRSTLLCCLPVGLLLALLQRRKHGDARRRFGTAVAFVFALAITLNVTGCSGLSTSGTPPGTYSFKVVGTGQGSGTTQAQAITLVVTQ